MSAGLRCNNGRKKIVWLAGLKPTGTKTTMAKVKADEIQIQFWAVKYFKDKNYATSVKAILQALGNQPNYKFSIRGILTPGLAAIVAKGADKASAIVELDKFIKVLDEMDDTCRKEIMSR
jgi:hypothetical protein